MMGGGGAGGFSGNIGGSSGPMGAMRGRSRDGWDDQELGKAYDPEVVKRALPFIADYKPVAFLALFALIIAAITQFTQPLFIGLITAAAVSSIERRVTSITGQPLSANMRRA